MAKLDNSADQFANRQARAAGDRSTLVEQTAYINAAVISRVREARDFRDDEVQGERATDQRYLRGETDLEEEGDRRSNYSSAEIRDRVDMALGPLMEAFAGAESVCEFVGEGEQGQAEAKAQTEFAEHAIWSSPNAYNTIRGWMRDGLALRVGALKVQVKCRTHTKFHHEALPLGMDEAEAIDEIEGRGWTHTGFADEQQFQMSDGSIATQRIGRFRSREDVYGIELVPIPPEELIWNRWATDTESAVLVAHDGWANVGDLAHFGLDADELLSYGHAGSLDHDRNDEHQARTGYQRDDEYEDRADPATTRIQVIEGWMRLDYDNDSVAEIVHFIAVGDPPSVVWWDETDGIDIVLCRPMHRPHSWLADSYSERLRDHQEVVSSLMRGLINNTHQSTDHRWRIDPDAEYADDLALTQVGAAVRARAGEVEPFATPYTGQGIISSLAHLERMAEQHTGISRAAVGLDPGQLANQVEIGVAAILGGGYSRIDDLARTIAEASWKPLMQTVVRIAARYPDYATQTAPRGMRLPQRFDDTMECRVRAGLGYGGRETKLKRALGVFALQQQIVGALGLNNPFVQPQHIAETLRVINELSGFEAEFFTPREAVMQLVQQMQQQPDPAQQAQEQQAAGLAEAARIEAQGDLAEKQMDVQSRLQIEQAKLQASLREKEMELATRLQIEAMKQGVTMDVAQLRAAIDQAQMAVQLAKG